MTSWISEKKGCTYSNLIEKLNREKTPQDSVRLWNSKWRPRGNCQGAAAHQWFEVMTVDIFLTAAVTCNDLRLGFWTVLWQVPRSRHIFFCILRLWCLKRTLYIVRFLLDNFKTTIVLHLKNKWHKPDCKADEHSSLLASQVCRLGWDIHGVPYTWRS